MISTALRESLDVSQKICENTGMTYMSTFEPHPELPSFSYNQATVGQLRWTGRHEPMRLHPRGGILHSLLPFLRYAYFLNSVTV
jgi:hypothetical protein